MAAQYIPIKRISSLDTPIKAEKLDGSLFTTENQAHEFIISVRKNGVKQTVTGSVSGKFIRANGTTIFLQGSIVDGDAVVRLHQDCYNVQGRFTFNIFNTQSGVTTCIYSAVGKIDMGSTETVIDAGDVVPDISDVVAKQEEMTQVIADARTATTAANTAATNVGSIVAGPYSAPYNAGEYCTQNGIVYKAKQGIPSDEEWTASHWTRTVVGDELTDLKSAINNAYVNRSGLEQYLYKKNTYINNSGAETALNGYDTYKVPVTAGDMFLLKQISGSETFYNGVNTAYVFHLLKNNAYENVYLDGSGTHPTYHFHTAQTTYDCQFGIWCEEGMQAVLFTIKRGNENLIIVQKNDAYQILNDPGKVDFRNTLITLSDENTITCGIYKTENGIGVIFTAGYTVHHYRVYAGDVVNIPQKTTGVNYYGFYYNSETQSALKITNSIFTAIADGFVEIFKYASDTIEVTVKPANGINIDYSNVKNVPVRENPFDGLNAVAFGTSLTYRAQTTGGYLQYLPTLSGITFDNQGLGSSTILPSGSLPQMMPMITGYNGYAGKRVCILEGFVNDFYYNGEHLGTWKDTSQDTVCGCVRYALNYILTQNPNLTVFMVMDHYGKGITAANAVNSAGQTSYEFYQEIEKVALSMGVRVIREYELSEISQLTPQYLLDNIHLNDLGAKQSANAIWGEMKKTYPNEVSA